MPTQPAPKLRDYQRAAKASVFQARSEGARTIAGRMFTGGGKTVVFADIIRDLLPLRTMVVAHRQELIYQARDKIAWVAGISVGVEMGEMRASIKRDLLHPRDSVIVSTIQTLTAGGDGAGRIGKFDPADFGALIVDEAHRAVSPSYRRVIDYFLTNQNLFVLGVTATPDRADEQALGQVFEMVPEGFDYDMNYGRQNGWLAEIDAQEVFAELDFSQVRATSEDLNSADLSRVMTAEKPLYGIVDAVLSLAPGKKGIGFSPSVEHARMTADIFNRYEPGIAAFIHGGTDKDERNRINSQFASGKIRWIWNCGTHTEGFDDDEVEVIVPKPTTSRALYEQMIGRGTRPHDSIASRLGTIPIPALRRQEVARSKKPSCLVLDFYGNDSKHKLVTVFDILGGYVSEEARQACISFARNAGRPVRVAPTLEEEEKRQAEIKAKQEAEAARKAKVIVKAKVTTRKIDPFDLLSVRPVASRGWHEGKKLSDRQRSVLANAGYDPDSMEYGRGAQLCGMILDRYRTGKCTIKQASKLQEFGYSKDETKDMSKEAATKALDAIAKNGWKRPQAYEATIPDESAVGADDSDGTPLATYDESGVTSEEVPF